MSLSKQQVSEYRDLKNSGVSVEKENKIAYNEGSETSIHCVAKMLTGLIGIQNGYRVDSEVPVTDRHGNEFYIDVLLWGHDSRTTFAVEPDHSPTVEQRDHKIANYVDGTAVQDLLLLDLNQMPAHITEAYGWIGSELGLPA